MSRRGQQGDIRLEGAGGRCGAVPPAGDGFALAGQAIRESVLLAVVLLELPTAIVANITLLVPRFLQGLLGLGRIGDGLCAFAADLAQLLVDAYFAVEDRVLLKELLQRSSACRADEAILVPQLTIDVH